MNKKNITTEQLRKTIKLLIKEQESLTKAPTDVIALKKAQQSSSSVLNTSKRIDTIQEFPGAFKDWLNNTSITPDKFSRSTIESQVKKVLVELGFK